VKGLVRHGDECHLTSEHGDQLTDEQEPKVACFFQRPKVHEETGHLRKRRCKFNGEDSERGFVDIPTVQLLNPEGERVAHDDYQSHLDRDAVFGLYRDMVIIRRFCNEATSLQRQGQLALWAPIQGQEAAQIGAGRALQPNDWSFPSYREHGIAWTRGIAPTDMLRLFRGVAMGGWNPNEYHHSVPTIVIANQAVNAVGYAMGMQLDGVDDAVLACFGDGATSQGDVAEAFVFAARFNAPVVFFVQNNQWAISEPTTIQTRTPIYQRASGFGFPGVRVDGNDVLAVYEVVRAALDRARHGEGPTLVEAFTYRMGAHTTSDDPTRYRVDADVEVWRHRDPIERVQSLLVREYKCKTKEFDAVRDEAEAIAMRMREEVLALPDPTADSFFTHAYATAHPWVAEGLEEVRALGMAGA
jgi:2-oxoisovalerate dehydrogenase E1 component alpha subunit